MLRSDDLKDRILAVALSFRLGQTHSNHGYRIWMRSQSLSVSCRGSPRETWLLILGCVTIELNSLFPFHRLSEAQVRWGFADRVYRTRV